MPRKRICENTLVSNLDAVSEVSFVEEDEEAPDPLEFSEERIILEAESEVRNSQMPTRRTWVYRRPFVGPIVRKSGLVILNSLFACLFRFPFIVHVCRS